jgi:excisionase family DNA binding protein
VKDSRTQIVEVDVSADRIACREAEDILEFIRNLEHSEIDVWCLHLDCEDLLTSISHIFIDLRRQFTSRLEDLLVKPEVADKVTYSTSEVASIFGCSSSTIKRMICNGDITAIKIGSRWQIPRKGFDEEFGVQNLENYTCPEGEYMRYNAFRGGHAPGYIRDAFDCCAEISSGFRDFSLDSDVTYYVSDWLYGKWTLNSLLCLLWNCTDIMPGMLCVDLDLPEGSTYAQAAREVKDQLSRLNHAVGDAF